jgi:Zn-dependent peptidase ImmA (M78 family)
VDAKFDGLAGSMGNTPLIVISQQQPGDRQRFTLAHELGHLIVNGRLNKKLDEEKACNRFAGAFLLPEDSLKQQLGAHRNAIELQELYMLKHEFGLSMGAILMRALQCGVITEYRYKGYNIEFAKKGWKTLEPGAPYPKEETYLFKQLVYRALAEEYIGESKAAELLSMALTQFHKERKLGEGGAATYQ